MTSQQPVSTYHGNQLIEACGSILDPAEVAKRLVHLPPRPSLGAEVPRHLLPHLLADAWRLHIPTSVGIEIALAMDMMIRQGYVHRHPRSPATWRRIYSLAGGDADLSPVQLASLVTGLPGTGKSTAIERALGLYPQVVLHESLPGFVGPVKQLIWLKIDVPASGKMRDLVEALALASDAALGTCFTETILRGGRASAASLAQRWLQYISCHFPGIIVFDEVQNLFKIQLKSVREQVARNRTGERPALRIIDDEALKLLLTITNVSKIPTLWCTTPDGMAALGARMSTSQRLTTAGFHRIPHPASADDDFFRKRLALLNFEWVAWEPATQVKTRRSSKAGCLGERRSDVV